MKNSLRLLGIALAAATLVSACAKKEDKAAASDATLETDSQKFSYAIGVAKPLSIYANTFETNTVPEAEIEKALARVMDLTPKGISDHLNLCRPIYRRTAAYGHFGRAPEDDGGFSWERTDLIEALQKAI